MADILIRGMEMPKNCTECPCFSQWDDCGINHEWKFADEFDKTKDRLPSCPLLPLPEKHGRLIDAGVFRDQLIELAMAGKDAASIWLILFVEEMLNNAPTIVPAEGGTDECSEN